MRHLPRDFVDMLLWMQIFPLQCVIFTKNTGIVEESRAQDPQKVLKWGSPRSALGQNGKSGVAQPLKLHRSFRSAPGQKVGTPILAFQASGQ